ncbi:MAG: phosphoribosyltransferase [Thaumarchaeota archaeon]|nr:phosphoribosyltransferase [Nitrososphaerota archaeon]
MRLKDRKDAGLQLAERLSWLKTENEDNNGVIVLAIPRGGVIVADEIAKSLNVMLDVVVPRKLGAPYNPELAIGAVMHDSSSYINEYVTNTLRIEQDYITSEIDAQVKEIERRLALYRGSSKYDLEGKTIVMVDDGIATGATMMVAILWVKKQKPKMVILAVPVASEGVTKKLGEIVDSSVVLHTPLEFGAVGEFYEDFGQISDQEVIDTLRKYKTDKI